MRSWILAGLTVLLVGACVRTPVQEQVRALGNREFSPEAWAVATPVEREQMLGSFFSQYPAERLTVPQVKRLLGQPTAYYDYDANLAYYVGPSTVKSKYGKERMLVFITDKRTGAIEEVELVPPLN